MSKFSVGQKVWVKSKKVYGTVTEVDNSGNPTKVDIGNQIIEVVSEVIKTIGILKQLWLLIKGIFKK